MRFGSSFISAIILCVICFSGSGWTKTLYVSPNGNNLSDGSSWALAKKSIQSALTTAVSGDEVQVAGGTYAEQVTLKDGVALRGGYSGAGDARNLRSYPTIIKLDSSGTDGVNAVTGANNSTIEGFTICGGSTGIACSQTSTRILRNTIIGNINCGVSVTGSTPVIAGNLIASNGQGISASGACTATITNNTIAANTREGIQATGTSTTVIRAYNNIIAQNQVGISVGGASAALVKNDLYSNATPYSPTTLAHPSDIASDPLFLDSRLGNFHIRGDSPCVDSADGSAPEIPALDLEDQAKPWGTGVDMGCDEYSGESYPAPYPAKVIYVNANAATGGNGSSWDLSYKKLQAALDDALANGGAEVWVAGGSCAESVKMWPFTHMFGGFAAGDTWEGRNPASRKTTVDSSSVIGSQNTVRIVGSDTVDGFEIRGAVNAGLLWRMCSPMITNNTITACRYGIWFCDGSAAIRGNSIKLNTSDGINSSVYISSPLMSNPTITENQVWQNGGSGIRSSGNQLMITSNSISENTTRGVYLNAVAGDSKLIGNRFLNQTASIYCYSCSPTVACNTISGNTANALECASSSSPLVVNNTLVLNSTAVQVSSTSNPTLANNIIAFNTRGVRVSNGTPTLINNDVFQNGSDYYPTTLARPSDISANPNFASIEFGDLHIRGTSLCRDAGNNGVAGIPQTDMDLQQRRADGRVDIGADEYNGESYPDPYQGRVIYVNASAATTGDGKSWSGAYQTIQEALSDIKVNGGAEVWVARGTYRDVYELPICTHLYGGFTAGDTKALRDPQANLTKLQNSLYNPTCADYNTLDGFTFSGSKGVVCSRSLTTISNNVFTTSGTSITCTTASPTIVNNRFSGAGISCDSASPLITNNIISAGSGNGIILNNASSPTISNNLIVGRSTGIYCVESSPIIVNNTISACTSQNIICYTGSSAVVKNNILSFGSYGIRSDATSTPVLSTNDVYGNGWDYSPATISHPTDIQKDPRFAGRSEGSYQLLADSPCIDAGTASGAPSTDFYGNIRGSGKPDIGFFEGPDNYKNIVKAKSLPDGSTVGIDMCVPTAIFSGRFYAESYDRSCGIGVIGSCAHMDRWLTIEGVMATVDGERVIDLTAIVERPTTWTVKSFHLNSDSIGGGPVGLQGGVMDYRLIKQGDEWVRDLVAFGGANNIGLLIVAVGRIARTEEGIYLHGVSNFDDGNGSIQGIRIDWPFSQDIPAEGSLVRMEAISSCTIKDGMLTRMLRPVSPEKVTVIK